MKTQIVNKLYGGDASLNQYQSKSYLRNSLSKTWILNNVTGTNGIATWGDLSTTYVTRGTSNQCPTKSQIQGAVKSGYDVTISSSYSSNQLVKYSDIHFYSTKYTMTFANEAKAIQSVSFEGKTISSGKSVVILIDVSSIIGTYTGQLTYTTYASNSFFIYVDNGHAYFDNTGSDYIDLDLPGQYGFTVEVNNNADVNIHLT